MVRYKIIVMLFIFICLTGCAVNEQRNLDARYTRIEWNTSLVGYITCINRTGQVVFSGVVNGKVTRAGRDNEGYYVFWFDQANRYHQWNGEYFYTDYLLQIVADPILIE